MYRVIRRGSDSQQRRELNGHGVVLWSTGTWMALSSCPIEARCSRPLLVGSLLDKGFHLWSGSMVVAGVGCEPLKVSGPSSWKGGLLGPEWKSE